MTRYAQHVNRRATPQTVQADRLQVPNSAGGFSFKLDQWDGLDRWLILGSEGGSYYASEQKLTVDNARTVQECLDQDGPRAVSRIVEISKGGRAPKNDPAIFALAMASGHKDLDTRRAALAAIPEVCRTGTHLFSYVDSVKNFRGWGRGLRNGVMGWYMGKDPDSLAYQVVKYQSRGGFSHRDVLRLAGGARDEWDLTQGHEAVLRWAVAGMDMGKRKVKRVDGPDRTYKAIRRRDVPDVIVGWEKMKAATTVREAVALIQEYGLTHEMVKNDFKSDPKVWSALLETMPVTACIRNLGRMTANGTLAPMSSGARKVVDIITDKARLERGRVHPLSVLMALKTYASGEGVRGSLTWSPLPQVVDALDAAFDLAFGSIKPSGKRELLAIDVSGSMSWEDIAGMPGITPRVGAAAMAMTAVRTEAEYHTMAFSSQFTHVALTKRQRLDDVMLALSRIRMGRTDCALPMTWAAENRIPVDTFRVYTDSETYCGSIHPHQALKKYRQAMGIPAKLIVVGMVANDISIADPNDAGMLDVVGFDTASPNIMNEFSRQ